MSETKEGIKTAYTTLQELFEITGPTVRDMKLIEDREKIRTAVLNTIFLLMYVGEEEGE